jgi:methylated-DNA-[protein]-cysteine S-methyltransferase
MWRGSSPTPAGLIYFTVAADTLVSATFSGPGDLSLPERKRSDFHSSFRAYCSGDLSALDNIPVNQQGTEFSESVYAHMRLIPPGGTSTYGDLANRAGYPKAARAVGTVCARNEIVLVVPCHRVVASHGLGGYGYGITLKRALLEHEGISQFK